MSPGDGEGVGLYALVDHDINNSQEDVEVPAGAQQVVEERLGEQLKVDALDTCSNKDAIFASLQKKIDAVQNIVDVDLKALRLLRKNSSSSSSSTTSTHSKKSNSSSIANRPKVEVDLALEQDEKNRKNEDEETTPPQGGG